MSRAQSIPATDLEESAQGQDLFRSPGHSQQLEQARDQAEASGWLPEAVAADWPSTEANRHIINRRQEFYDAMRALEAAAARPSGLTDWLDGIGAALSKLESALISHIDQVEAPDGLLNELLERAPQTNSQIAALRRDHAQLLAGCQVLSAGITAQADVEVSSLRRRVNALLGSLAVHRQRGAEVLYDAYNVDIGAAN